MITIVIPIESEGSSFFNRRYAIVSPIPAKDILTQKMPKFWNRLTKKVQKNRKKFYGGETKKAARLESCLDDEIVNVFNDGKEIDD